MTNSQCIRETERLTKRFCVTDCARLSLVVALLVFAQNSSWADVVPRPSLLITKQHVDHAKKLIASYEWAAKLHQGVRRAAVSGTIRQEGVIYEGNHVAQGIVYQIDGDTEMAARAKERLLAMAGKFRSGKRYPWGIPVEWAVTYDLIADACTPEERRRIEEYLRRLANEAMKWHKKNHVDSTTPNMSFVCHWKIGITGYAIGDDAIIDWALHDAPATKGGLFATLEHGLRDKKLWLEAPIYGDFVLYGMVMMAEAARNSRGIDLYTMPANNGATIRSFVDGLFSMAYPIERTGVQGGSIRQITWGDVSTHSPDINHQHGGHVDPFYVNKPDAHPEHFNLYHIFTIANHLRPDPRYQWLLDLNPRHNEPVGWFAWFPWALFYTDASRTTPSSPPAMPSAIYPELGLAILRADESPSYWSSGKPVLVHQTGEPYGHANWDHMQIMLFANGRLLYHSPDQRPYSRIGFAPQRFNKVVVDRQHNSWSNGRSRQRFEFNTDVKFLTNSASGLNPGVNEVRSLFLTGEYAADFYDLTSESPHTYDWFIHAIGKGQLTHESLYTPSRDFASDYPWIEEERKWETETAVRVDFTQRAAGVVQGVGSWSEEWRNGFAGVRMTLLGEPGTTVYGCEDLRTDHEVAWGHGQGGTPTFCARRMSKGTTFVALHEPYSRSPKLSVRHMGRDRRSRAIRIEGPDFVDVVATAFDDGKTVHVLRDARGTEQVSFSNYAWIRITGGTVTAHGGIRSFLLSVPEAAAEGSLMVDGKAESYTRSSGALVFGEKRPPARSPLMAAVARDDVPRRVGPGESFRFEVPVTNPTDVRSQPHHLGLALPDTWKVIPQLRAVNLDAGARCTVVFDVTVPPDARAGSVQEVHAWLKPLTSDSSNQLPFPVGRLAITRPLVIRFTSESIRLARNGTGTARLLIRNPTGYAVRGEIRITGRGNVTVVSPRLMFGPIAAGDKLSQELTVKGGDRNELGELKAELVRVERVEGDGGTLLPLGTADVTPASLLTSVGVTISEDVRHKLPYTDPYPVWIIRSPTYEIWISQNNGLARTMFDSTGRSIYGDPWGLSSGLCRFSRVVDGVERIVHGSGKKGHKRGRGIDSPLSSAQWRGSTLVCESQFGDTIEIEFTEQHIHWHVKSPTPQSVGLGYRMSIASFYAHPPSFTAWHCDSDQRPTGWPVQVGPLSYSVIRQPGYSTDSIWIAATGTVPRCTLFDRTHKNANGHKGIRVNWNWLKRAEFDLYIGVSPEREVLRHIRDAAGVE